MVASPSSPPRSLQPSPARSPPQPAPRWDIHSSATTTTSWITGAAGPQPTTLGLSRTSVPHRRQESDEAAAAAAVASGQTWQPSFPASAAAPHEPVLPPWSKGQSLFPETRQQSVKDQLNHGFCDIDRTVRKGATVFQDTSRSVKKALDTSAAESSLLDAGVTPNTGVLRSQLQAVEMTIQRAQSQAAFLKEQLAAAEDQEICQLMKQEDVQPAQAVPSVPTSPVTRLSLSPGPSPVSQLARLESCPASPRAPAEATRFARSCSPTRSRREHSPGGTPNCPVSPWLLGRQSRCETAHRERRDAWRNFVNFGGSLDLDHNFRRAPGQYSPPKDVVFRPLDRERFSLARMRPPSNEGTGGKRQWSPGRGNSKDRVDDANWRSLGLFNGEIPPTSKGRRSTLPVTSLTRQLAQEVLSAPITRDKDPTRGRTEHDVGLGERSLSRTSSMSPSPSGKLSRETRDTSLFRREPARAESQHRLREAPVGGGSIGSRAAAGTPTRPRRLMRASFGAPSCGHRPTTRSSLPGNMRQRSAASTSEANRASENGTTSPHSIASAGLQIPAAHRASCSALLCKDPGTPLSSGSTMFGSCSSVVTTPASGEHHW